MLLAVYLTLVSILALHGVHRWALLWTWWRTRSDAPVAPPLVGLPRVTVQLPVFNERDVIERLVDAAAALDWPADRLQIQLLDDSTDDTAACAARALQRARARGISVELRHRDVRSGYKAGALAEGLRTASGAFIAIFDADFVPAPDFLRRTVAHFADAGVGMVQCRWAHLNAEASPLTQAQAVMLDGHFVIEHTARNRGGMWFNFNGTAGVWRRETIAAAGGWQHDTLTEDLDLSYRAQLAGWRFVYLVDDVVPAELPATMGALRSQQRRWAKGSVETAQKLRGRILAAGVPLRVKAEAMSHLHANLSWPFGLLLASLLPVVVMTQAQGTFARHWLVDLPGFAFATLPHLVFYTLASRGRARWALPVLVLCVGLAVGQTVAVIEALLGRKSEFVRTPKQGDGAGSYRPGRAGTAPIELALCAWQVYAVWAAIQAHAWGSIPFLLLFATGFGWVGFGALLELRRAAEPEPTSALAK